MGIFHGKRKKGLKLTSRKPTTYFTKKEKVSKHCHALYSPSYSPDRKKARHLSPSINSKKFQSKFLSTPKSIYGLGDNIDCPDFSISPLAKTNAKRKLEWTPNGERSNISQYEDKELEEHFSSLNISGLDEINRNNNDSNIPPVSLEELEIEAQIREIEKLLPHVLKVLAAEGKKSIIKDFFQLLHDDKFPLKNIAFKLWTDVVQWFTLADTRCMRYSDETLQFFWLGRKLFGGRFVRFMSGMKNETDVLLGQQTLDPQFSKINFACPHENMLRDIKPLGDAFPGVIKPGLLSEVITMKKDRDTGKTSYVLMFDGKKVKRGGDVNLLGHEKGKSVEKRKDERDIALSIFDSAIQTAKYALTKCSLICETGGEDRKAVKDKLMAAIEQISHILRQLRELKKSKDLSLTRLKNKAGGDWRGSKYVFAIDTCMTILYRLETAITNALSVQKTICKAVASLNEEEKLFAKADIVDLSFQKNVKLLKEPEDIKLDVGQVSLDCSITKQRTEKWFDDRNKMKVTGSTIYSAIGCDGLKNQKKHFDKVFSKTTDSSTSAEQIAAMKHGVDSEIHEIATLSGIIMPVLFPGHVFYEEGYYVKDDILVSPDGSIRLNGVPIYAFEGKAPVGNAFTTPVHYKIPDRYITQTLFERAVLEAKGTIYLCWSSESTTLFHVPPDDKICNKVLGDIEKVYKAPVAKRPVRLSNVAKEIKKGLSDIASKECIFLGEFPSVYGCQSTNKETVSSSGSPYIESNENNNMQSRTSRVTFHDLIRNLLIAKDVAVESYELQREMASQVIVVLISDLDRMWKPEEPHAVPVMYFFRGYSLPMETMRKLVDQCKSECKQQGIDVIVSSADGEFYPIMVRSKTGRPLTKFQLSKDVWNEVTKLKKSEILTKMEYIFKKFTMHKIYKGNPKTSHFHKMYVVDSPSIKTPNTGWNKTDKKNKQTADKDETDNAMNVEGLGTTEDTGMVVETSSNVKTSVDQVESQTTMESDDPDATILLFYNLETEDSQNENTERQKIGSDEMKNIHILLKETNESKWQKVSERELWTYFESAKSLEKFTVKELNQVTRFLNMAYKKEGIDIKITGKLKADLVNQLSELFIDGSTIEKPNKRQKKRKPNDKKDVVPTLRELSRRILDNRKYPKQVLNIAYSSLIWPEKVKEWYEQSSVSPEVEIVDLDEKMYPYYVPNVDESGEFEVFVYDKTHLGSNLRKAICVNKVEGISKHAWIKTATSRPDLINPTLLEVSEEGKIIDQMKESIAKTMFSLEVETVMRENGSHVEANFCKVIREALYIADDKPGISALDRCRYRLNLIKWLDDGVDFGEFPPFGARIKGLSYVLYEGMRASMEAKLYLHALSKSGTYCARAPNTLCSESFFSTMQEMDPWGQGILTTSGVEKHITDFTMITALKMKEDKPFQIRTKKDAAYPVQEIPQYQTDESLPSTKCNCREKKFIRCIHPRNHYFDTDARSRVSRVDKPYTFSDINEPARGIQPIRQQYGYKVNEGKILLSKRLGINLDK